jgi:mannan endo-1,4-beta-mannosidase
MMGIRTSIQAGRQRLLVLVVAAAVLLGMAGIGVGIAFGVIPLPSFSRQPGATGSASVTRIYAHLPADPDSYLGVYEPGAPRTYAPFIAFGRTMDHPPNLAIYYSGWREPFQTAFAGAAAANGATPVVQIDPTGIDLAAIAAGDYDSYLTSYAEAVHAWGKNVVIGFGHEMNGYWYSWSHLHTSPAVFVAAWRHIVSVFRAEGDFNVTWLWTVNIIDTRDDIPSPARWWPGSAYVSWVGIDGYYLKPDWRFASLFGPTIKAVRALTLDPIIISETGALSSAAQPVQITDLFAGIRGYGLLGFVWFDADKNQDWLIRSPEAVASFRRSAATFKVAAS